MKLGIVIFAFSVICPSVCMAQSTGIPSICDAGANIRDKLAEESFAIDQLKIIEAVNKDYTSRKSSSNGSNASGNAAIPLQEMDVPIEIKAAFGYNTDSKNLLSEEDKFVKMSLDDEYALLNQHVKQDIVDKDSVEAWKECVLAEIHSRGIGFAYFTEFSEEENSPSVTVNVKAVGLNQDVILYNIPDQSTLDCDYTNFHNKDNTYDTGQHEFGINCVRKSNAEINSVINTNWNSIKIHLPAIGNDATGPDIKASALNPQGPDGDNNCRITVINPTISVNVAGLRKYKLTLSHSAGSYFGEGIDQGQIDEDISIPEQVKIPKLQLVTTTSVQGTLSLSLEDKFGHKAQKNLIGPISDLYNGGIPCSSNSGATEWHINNLTINFIHPSSDETSN